jgi:hypothetical protein
VNVVRNAESTSKTSTSDVLCEINTPGISINGTIIVFIFKLFTIKRIVIKILSHISQYLGKTHSYLLAFNATDTSDTDDNMRVLFPFWKENIGQICIIGHNVWPLLTTSGVEINEPLSDLLDCKIDRLFIRTRK